MFISRHVCHHLGSLSLSLQTKNEEELWLLVAIVRFTSFPRVMWIRCLLVELSFDYPLSLFTSDCLRCDSPVREGQEEFIFFVEVFPVELYLTLWVLRLFLPQLACCYVFCIIRVSRQDRGRKEGKESSRKEGRGHRGEEIRIRANLILIGRPTIIADASPAHLCRLDKRWGAVIEEVKGDGGYILLAREWSEAEGKTKEGKAKKGWRVTKLNEWSLWRMKEV